MSMLWCCHVRGPDDVHAAPDYETALKWSDMINALNWRDGRDGSGLNSKNPESYEDCLMKAVPAPWPYSAEDHAKHLPKAMAEFKVPALTSALRGKDA